MSTEKTVRKQMETSGQGHIFRWWDELTPPQREKLLSQIQSIDLPTIQSLHQQGESESKLPSLESLTIPDADVPGDKERALGEEALRKGEVAVILVAGGQGSRLQFPHAKGMYPIGPVSNCSLFQIHAEKLLAMGRRAGVTPLFLIMTSEATDEEVRAFFAEKQFFGLKKDDVIFFSQASLPAMTLDGKLLMEQRDRVFTSPNGHGGVLQALHDNKVMPRLRERGIQDIFYYQVDNPLVKVADAYFLGAHRVREADVSIKVVRKQSWDEPIGNFVLKDGRCDMIEYTELPPDWAKMETGNGQLKFWAGSIAIHIFSMKFLDRMVSDYDSLPYHIAKKKVPYLDEQGRAVEPDEANAFKFERFIFDVLPKAEKFALIETSHAEEFEPLKNKDGKNSPETVKGAMIALARDWLTRAGVSVSEGVDVEISPLFALDAEELASKVDASMQIDKTTYLIFD